MKASEGGKKGGCLGGLTVRKEAYLGAACDELGEKGTN